MTTIRHYGFLSVKIRNDRVTLSYGGNMGCRLKDVEECFNGLYPGVSFKEVLSYADCHGSPDYSWYAVLHRRHWDKIIGV